jgi:mono/diheme cytochrome c family protein
MPAFGDRLSESEIDDLVAYVMAVSALGMPDDPAVRRGYDRARALGCFGCHGAGGRLAQPSPGSLKGYIPSWDGDDFPELVRDRAEFGEWVEEGMSARFRASPFAREYLDRPPVRMPAYKDHLEPGDVDAMWSYVEWLRSQSAK